LPPGKKMPFEAAQQRSRAQPYKKIK
jgi:hypothetical protein